MLIKTIKYYENTKYTLKKGKTKYAQLSCVLHINVRFFGAIEMHCKRNIGTEFECIAKSMVTFFKFPLTYSMNLLKYIP